MRSTGPFNLHNHLEHLIRKVKAIGDERRPQRVLRQLFPEIIRVTSKDQVCAIAQMRGQGGKGVVSSGHMAPRLTDRMMEASMFERQKKDMPANLSRRDALFEPSN